MGRIMILKCEMARAYGISMPTFRNMLKQLGIYDKKKKHIDGSQMEKLEEHFGEPDYELLIVKPSGNA